MFKWENLLRAGLVSLRLPPEAFWDLTPAELRLMLGNDASEPMRHAGLKALMEAFPDTPPTGTAQEQGKDLGASHE